MTKGDPDGVADLLKRVPLTPVFSDESFAEIGRSTGYEQTFLELLMRIEAYYLVPILDKQSRHIGGAEVRAVNPSHAYRAYVENIDSLPEFDFGLTGMLQKFYGDRQDQSFEEILSDGAKELSDLSRSIKTLSRQRPLPSMLILIWCCFSTRVNSASVN